MNSISATSAVDTVDLRLVAPDVWTVCVGGVPRGSGHCCGGCCGA